MKRHAAFIAPALLSSCLGVTATQALAECEPSEEQQAMLERVNQARSEARQCGNEEHAAAEPLEWNCRLAEAAKAHSTAMAEKEFFSHTGADDEGVASRVSETGYTWMAVGENIAAGQAEVEAVMQGWLDSPGHCANIMSDEFTEMGAASVEAEGSRYSPYWTQVFARPR
ncbi:CAP domain-containing protein [Billgrantia antri]|uniref:CAP domain-containing protein n=1 Tax=Halomonas sulfidivorans TaxID=2733488 RepID=A0ABX7WFE7_9GAMM|nr:CAP domain-containing protein [Halomonas sulfidivorans]QTP58924.1 CAP domain-containing protein [Halomonas sulfidivorans]